MKVVYNFCIEDESILESIGLTEEEVRKNLHLSYSTIFIDFEDKKILGYFSEDDGKWRNAYFNPIFKNLGIDIQVIDIFDFSESQKEILKNILKEV